MSKNLCLCTADATCTADHSQAILPVTDVIWAAFWEETDVGDLEKQAKDIGYEL